MKMPNVVLLVSCLTALPTVAETNLVSLALYFPYTEMLSNEWCTYSITLINNSSNAIPILHDPQSMLNCQMIFDLGTERKYHRGYFYFDDGWDKINSFEKSRRRAVPLPPGESYTWEFPYGYSQLHQANELFNITNMSVRCLLGTNEWVRSNTVSLSFYSDDGKTVMFEPPNDSKLKNTKEIDQKLYKVKLGDELYLFNSLRQRICELPDDDHPVISRDIENDEISISFPKSNRVFLYNPKTTEVTKGQDGK